MKSLIEEYAGTVKADEVEFEASAEEIRTLLEKLYSLRAITDYHNPTLLGQRGIKET